MKARLALAASLLIPLSTAAAWAQTSVRTHKASHVASKTAMTAEDVARLTKAGVSDEVILAQIRAKHASFDLSVDQLVALKSAGVSDAVIRTMTNATTSQAAVTQAAVTKPAATKPAATRAAVTKPAMTNATAPPSVSSIAWLPHNDPSGFSVKYPQGWQVQTERQSGRIVILGPEKQEALIWPAFLRGRQLDSKSAAVLIRELAGRADPRLPWGMAQQEGNAIRVSARGETKGVALLRWNASAEGTSILLVCVTAPASQYSSSTEAFSGILNSFQFVADRKPAVAQTTAAPAKAAPKPPVTVAWTRWTDPREGAFSASVPQGWNVSGGAIRQSASDIRQSLVVQSPDGQVRITVGDPNIGIFTAPNAMYSRFGLRQATVGDGTRLQVRRFQPAAQFLNEYIRSTVARECSGVADVSQESRSDLVSASAQHARAQGATNPQVSAAGAWFSCNWNGREARGYYALASVLPLPGRSGIWYVENLHGFIASADRARQAGNIAQRVFSSMGINEQWQQHENMLAANAVQQDNERSAELQARARQAIADDERKTSDAIVNGYNARSKVYDEIDRKRENAILGTVDVVDPNTGRQYKIDNYSDYHWMSDSGVIAGTRSDTSPGAGWHEMIDLP